MTTASEHLTAFTSQIEGLQDIGRRFYARGWSVGTSSNYSVVTNHDPLELVITASGKDKGLLAADDFVRIDHNGQPLYADQPKSSAETLLHTAIAANQNVGAVLHTHSVWGTILSDLYFESGFVKLAGYEMLKGLSGTTTHECEIPVRIFDNTQDIKTLADEFLGLLKSGAPGLTHAFLMRGHGLYTWGSDLNEARRHVEVLEFLFEVIGRKIQIAGK